MSELVGSKRKPTEASREETRPSNKTKKAQQAAKEQLLPPPPPPAAGSPFVATPSVVHSSYRRPPQLLPGSSEGTPRQCYPYHAPPQHAHYRYYDPRPHPAMSSVSAVPLEGSVARISPYVTPDPRHLHTNSTSTSPLFSRRGGAPRPSAPRHRPAGGTRATPSSTSPASTFSSPAETSGARYDSSLGTLTRRFVHLLKSVPGQSIDLNDAVKQLGVQKRRIYDITNVLEGIGMIRKDGKNSVAWCGDINVDFNAPQDEQIEKVKRTHEQEVIASQTESKESKRARQELLKAKAHEKKLDSYMRQIGDQIAHYTHEGEHTQGFDYRKHPSTSRRPHYSQQPHPNMYIRYSDLANHPGYKDDNLIALRAPQGTNIEVPDPDQSGKQGERSYQMYMTSQNRGSNPAHAQRGAPIDVHLVRPNTTGNDAIRASVETSKESSPPSPIRSTTNKSDAHNTPVKRVPSEQPETATRPSPFKDASTGQHPHWLQSGNPVSPWVGSPVHGRHQYGHHDFSLGPEASPQRQGHAQFSFSPLHKFTSKHPEPGDFKKSPSDTPERERQAMGLMNSPLGEVLPSTPGLGRTEAALTSKLNYCTQGSPTGSLGDLGRSDSPLYGLSSLASLPPIYSPQPGSSVPIRYSPSPLDWRFPGDSSPEKGSPEE